MLADTEYRHQIALADIGPIRGLLLGFFFMTVGMAVDVRSPRRTSARSCWSRSA